MTKARETIEPEVMTQIVTKAKEMGRLTTCKETFYNFFFSSIGIFRCVEVLFLIICVSTHNESIT